MFVQGCGSTTSTGNAHSCTRQATSSHASGVHLSPHVSRMAENRALSCQGKRVALPRHVFMIISRACEHLAPVTHGRGDLPPSTLTFARKAWQSRPRVCIVTGIKDVALPTLQMLSLPRRNAVLVSFRSFACAESFWCEREACKPNSCADSVALAREETSAI